MEFEKKNFRVDSTGWEERVSYVGHKRYLESPQKDMWEFLEGKLKGEQLFSWEAAMRETAKVGKRMPTDEEFTKLLKTKDMPNLILAGYRDTDGTFYDRGEYAYLWSSTESGADAWYRNLNSTYAMVHRTTLDKAIGFSVRCLKD